MQPDADVNIPAPEMGPGKAALGGPPAKPDFLSFLSHLMGGQLPPNALTRPVDQTVPPSDPGWTATQTTGPGASGVQMPGVNPNPGYQVGQMLAGLTAGSPGVTAPAESPVMPTQDNPNTTTRQKSPFVGDKVNQKGKSGKLPAGGSGKWLTQLMGS